MASTLVQQLLENRRGSAERSAFHRRNATSMRQQGSKKLIVAGTAALLATIVVVIVALHSWRPARGVQRVKVVQIPDALRQDLLSKLDAARLPNYRTHVKSFSRRSVAIVENTVKKFEMEHVFNELHTTGEETAVLIKGLPVDRIIHETPTDGSRSMKKKGQVIEALLIALGQSLTGGMPIGYSFEKGYSDPFIHEGFVREGGSALTVGTALAFHADMGYLRQPSLVPNFLGLFGVREGLDRKVTTEILDNRDILRFVPAETQKALRQPHFIIRIPQGVPIGKTNKNQSRIRPLLTGSASTPTIALPPSEGNVFGVDKVGHRALKILREAIDQAKRFGFVHRVHLMPGDLLLFDNRRVLHSRSAVRNKEALLPHPDGRVIFRAYFHSGLREPTMIVPEDEDIDTKSTPWPKINTIKASI